MTSKIVLTTADIQKRHDAQKVPTWGNESVLLDWSRIHNDRGVLLERLEIADKYHIALTEQFNYLNDDWNKAEATVEKLRQKVSGWREWADLSDTPESKDASECVKICADELEQLLEDVK